MDQNEQDKRDVLKTKEQWLREELRGTRTLMASVQQWGVTVLAAIETSLYYIRKDVATHLIELKQLAAGNLLPWQRWFLGTVFLAAIAFIFSRLTGYLQKKHIDYRRQLCAMNPSYSGITESQPPGSRVNWFCSVEKFHWH